MVAWYALVDREVVGPFDTGDQWYHDHAGPDWRHKETERSGNDPWRVAYDSVGDHHVSTVFLGLDHSWSDGPPLVFETMVLPEGEICHRASTWEQAEQMHAAILHSLVEFPSDSL